jgi:large subunit ribosomal protein L25
LPGSIYGKEIESFPVKVKEDEFKKSLSKYGRNYLFNLDLEGQETHTVIVKEIQHSPINRKILNIDFQQISLTEEIKADLEIRIIGKESIDLKKLLLIRQMDTIPVKGLPQNIPDNIEIDVSGLDEGQRIYISDINFPTGIVVEAEGDQTVLSVNAPVSSAIDVDEDEDGVNEIGVM